MRHYGIFNSGTPRDVIIIVVVFVALIVATFIARAKNRQ